MLEFKKKSNIDAHAKHLEVKDNWFSVSKTFFYCDCQRIFISEFDKKKHGRIRTRIEEREPMDPDPVYYAAQQELAQEGIQLKNVNVQGTVLLS